MAEHDRDGDEEVPEAYEAAFQKAAETADGRVADLLREIDEAVALLVEVLGQPAAARQVLIEGEVRFHSLKLCKLLLARSQEAWFRSPQEAVEIARLAVMLADRLDIAQYGTSLVENTRASAWAHLGNALRITSDLRQAEAALRTAEEHLCLGGGDPFTEAQILNYKSSLRIAQGNSRRLLACSTALLSSIAKRATATGRAGLLSRRGSPLATAADSKRRSG